MLDLTSILTKVNWCIFRAKIGLRVLLQQKVIGCQSRSAYLSLINGLPRSNENLWTHLWCKTRRVTLQRTHLKGRCHWIAHAQLNMKLMLSLTQRHGKRIKTVPQRCFFNPRNVSLIRSCLCEATGICRRSLVNSHETASRHLLT